MSLTIRCACGYTGPIPEAAPGRAITCPRCDTPVQTGSSLVPSNVEATRGDQYLVVRVRGKGMKVLEAETLVRLVFETHKDVKLIVVELSGVEYLGSAAFAALVRVAIERKLRLVNVGDMVRRTMRTTGLASYFHFAPDLETALKPD